MIPARITTALAAFQDAVSAARPISRAPALQTAALLRQGNALLASIDAAIQATGAPLDADEPSGTPMQMVAAVNALVAAGVDHSALHDMRGYVGRAVFNLAQGHA